MAARCGKMATSPAIACLAFLLSLSVSSLGLNCDPTLHDGGALEEAQQGHCLFQGTFEREMTGEARDMLSANSYHSDTTRSLVDSPAEQYTGLEARPRPVVALDVSNTPHVDEHEAENTGEADANAKAPTQDSDSNLVYDGVFGEQNVSAGKGVREQSPASTRADSSRAATAEHAEEHEESSHGHQSIFQLRFLALDTPMFWVIWFGMIAFTIVIDRAEAFATEHAKESKTEQMFLARLNAELTMFGCVGLGLFLCTNLVGNVPHEYFAIFEFTDIMCSCGAMGIILVALILYVRRHYQELQWIEYERLAGEAYRLQSSGSSVGLREGAELSTKVVEHTWMSAEFIRHHGLPQEFSYSEYLNECLAWNAVDLIDVQWTTWTLILLWCFLGFIVRAAHSDPLPPDYYLYFFFASHYLVFFLHVGFMVSIYSTYTAFRTELRENQGKDKSHSSDKMKGISLSSKSWILGCKYALQVNSLANSFLCAFYLMHVVYNIRIEQFNWYWNPVLAAPLAANCMICLPYSLIWLTLVQGLYSPNEQALETSLEFLSMYAEDVRYLGNMWNMKDRPTLPSIKAPICENAFMEQMRDTGLILTDARMHRVFRHFDGDHSGDLGIEECAVLMRDIMEQGQKGKEKESQDDDEEKAVSPLSARSLAEQQASPDRGANAG